MNVEDWECLERWGWMGERSLLSKVLVDPPQEHHAPSEVKYQFLPLTFLIDQQDLPAPENQKRLDLIQKIWNENKEDDKFRRFHRFPALIHQALSSKSYDALAFLLKASLHVEPLTTDRMHAWWVMWRHGNAEALDIALSALTEEERAPLLTGKVQMQSIDDIPAFEMLKNMQGSPFWKASQVIGVLEVFQKYGFDLKTLSPHTRSSVFQYISMDSPESFKVLEWIYQHVQHIDEPNMHGCTPLTYMMWDGVDPEMVEWFLKHGANPNHTQPTGLTLLTALASSKDGDDETLTQKAKLLLQYGADITYLNTNQESVLDNDFSGRPKLYQCLLSAWTSKHKEALETVIPMGSKKDASKKKI